MNSDALEQLRSNLGELLGHHGHPTSRYEDWLLIDGKFPAIRVSFYHQEASHPSVSQVDFQIAVAKDVVITESFGVVGDSDSELAVDALGRFSRNSLHVILASICEDTAAAQHVEIIELTGSKDSSWRAYLSGWELTTYEGMESTPPSAVFESVEALLKGRLCDTKIHWFRILLSTLGRTQLVEILWDNETWQEAEETVRRLDWVADNQQTARCFAIVLPQSSPPGG